MLDRAYVLPQPGVRPLWEAGLGSLRAALAARPALAQRTVKGLLTAIERERAGEGGATRPLLKSLLRLLSALVRAPGAHRCGACMRIAALCSLLLTVSL